ncbi:MAG: transposase, partial [Planctomycetales bacterium]|nr:transposase [Planctomycetales bacterium]
YTILRQRVNRLRERFPDDLMADVTAPGVTAIVSFTTLQLACGDGARQDAYLFRARLLYSGNRYLHFSPTCDLAATIYEHQRAFEHFGGVPLTVRYQEVPAVFAQPSSDDRPLNRTFLSFACHYGFRPLGDPLPNRESGEDQKFWRQLHADFVDNQTFRSLEHANDKLHSMQMTTTSHCDALGTARDAREKKLLIQLPTYPWSG